MKDLLHLLENDSTLSHAQLAAMTGSTEAEVAAAVEQYEKDRVILGYKTIIDWDRTQQESVTALIEVGVTPQRGEGFDRVAQRIYQYDEVESGYIVCNFLADPTEKGQFLVDCMIHGLEWIQGQYGKKYLELEIKEVDVC